MKSTSHHATSKRIFYRSSLHFVVMFVAASLLPILLVKAFFIFSPTAEVAQSLMNILIFLYAYLAIVVACVYALTQHSLVEANLKPVSKLAEVGDVASKVAHDIRSPLSGMCAVLKFMQHHPDPKTREYANLLEISSNRLEGISQDLLRTYKGVQALPEKNLSTFDIHEILNTQVYEFCSQKKYAKVTFHKQYAMTPIVLKFNKDDMARIINNILKNGAEAMKFDGEIRVHTAAESEKAIIRFEDNGPGLSTQKIKKILSGTSFTEGKKDGHGLGLSYVQDVLTRNGGHLSIQSRPGNGACFQIELPMISETQMSFGLQASAGDSVLVIDDDLLYLEEWKCRLQRLGVHAILGTSYEEIESRITNMKFGAAIVDYHFENSELDGFDIIEQLQPYCPHIYLCSGEYWKPSIQQQAAALDIPICPKPLPDIRLSKTGFQAQTSLQI